MLNFVLAETEVAIERFRGRRIGAGACVCCDSGSLGTATLALTSELCAYGRWVYIVAMILE
jgi:hypothetical protein